MNEQRDREEDMKSEVLGELEGNDRSKNYGMKTRALPYLLL
jgi:hypothetical protein